jgi:hypothetical protein
VKRDIILFFFYIKAVAIILKQMKLSLIFFVIGLSLQAWAQGNSAPIKWERYRDSNHGISILFPKMPTFSRGWITCAKAERSSYYAYADSAVYELTIYFKSNDYAYNCRSVAKFDKDLLAHRLAELRDAKPDDPAIAAAVNDTNVIKVKADQVTTWVFPDIAKGRWIEIAIHCPNDMKVDERHFIESLDMKSKDGIDIGDGAEATIGDADVDVNTIPVADTAGPTVPLKLVSKRTAPYTNSARQNNVMGTVKLKVTFLRNGSIGAVTPVTILKYGLTENAIAAAKKIVFIPKRINGVNVNTTLMFDYGFSIY